MRNMSKLVLLSALTILLSATSCQSQSSGGGKTVLSPNEFQAQLDKTNDEILLDVRTPGEYADGFIAGAKNIDWNGNGFEKQASALDKNKPVYVYCLGGGRSRAAASKLRQLGFKEVYDLDGGMMNWKRAGMPVATSNGAATAPKTSGMNMADYTKLLEGDKLVLVDFFATWCGPCKKMAPFLKEMSHEEEAYLKVVKVDADENEALSTEMQITGLPTLLLYKNGKLVWQHLGYIGKEELLEKISKFK